MDAIPQVPKVLHRSGASDGMLACDCCCWPLPVVAAVVPVWLHMCGGWVVFISKLSSMWLVWHKSILQMMTGTYARANNV